MYVPWTSCITPPPRNALNPSATAVLHEVDPRGIRRQIANNIKPVPSTSTTFDRDTASHICRVRLILSNMRHFTAVFLLSLLSTALSNCFNPSPAFPVPFWQHQHGAHSLKGAFFRITAALQHLAKDEKYDTSSFSVGITSSTETIFSHYHTARKHNDTRPGDTHIYGQSQYRIASITKTFTTLGLLYQHAAGNLSLDDPVTKYIPELESDGSGTVPWHDITLRIMASQLSGIPREIAQADLINAVPNAVDLGFPPVSKDDYDLDLPECYEYKDYQPCNWTHLMPHVRKSKPIFAPNQESTYSNANFELLGLVLERVTGLSYEEYMSSAIFSPLGMESTTLTTPSDEHAVLPVGQWFWNVNEGVHNPTGGIYSSLVDMSKYARYILTHYNALATGVNWFMPASWSGSAQTFYGMPWEIFRTTSILEHTQRPVTFVTKGGAVPAYFSSLDFLPEYGLAYTILVGGEHELVEKIQEIVSLELVREAEKVIWTDVDETYSGTYTAANSDLNSSLTFTTSPSRGLELTTFISNSTDVFTALLPMWVEQLGLTGKPWHLQLVPTLLYKDEAKQQGEIWRILIVAERTGEEGLWDEEFCPMDVDPTSYAGLPVNEVVWWHEEGLVELPAYRVKMRKVEVESDEGRFVVQQDL